MQRNIFKSLRVKISVGILIPLAIVLISLITTFNVYTNSTSRYGAQLFFDKVLQNEGEISLPSYTSIISDGERLPRLKNKNPENESDVESNVRKPLFYRLGIYPASVEGIYSRNYFSVKLTPDQKLIEVIHDFVNDISEEPIKKAVQKFNKSNKNRGFVRSVGYAREERPYGYLLVILDMSQEQAQHDRFLWVSILLFGACLIVCYGISWVLASMSLDTAKESIDKQNQFIADASHELKTPIAVIRANVDVLEQDIPDNKWLGYIRTESDRMSGLVKDLLFLAKNDSFQIKQNYMNFDLCKAVELACLPFESIAFEQGKQLEINIPNHEIEVYGDEEKIKQVAVILTDNALKNSDQGDQIKISVQSDTKKCWVKVFNTGSGISKENMKNVFDRFFRIDSSRARNTGGYGLGLSIAQTVAKNHKGKITVASEVGYFAEFCLILPLDLNKKSNIQSVKKYIQEFLVGEKK